MPSFHSIPIMVRKSKSTKVELISIFFNEIDERWEMRVEILVALINFHVRGNILLNPILPVTLSFFEIIVHKMWIVHDFLQKLRRINTSTDKY